MKTLKDIKNFDEMINQVINADCLEAMKKMPDNSVDISITSPPYNVGWNNMNGKDFTRYQIVEDNMEQDDYRKWTYEILDNLIRVSKKHVFYNIQALSNNTPIP